MSRRDQIRMNDEEIHAFLEQERTLQVATIDHDGFPHLVAMWYILINDEVVFWTYARSQKAVNTSSTRLGASRTALKVHESLAGRRPGSRDAPEAL